MSAIRFSRLTPASIFCAWLALTLLAALPAAAQTPTTVLALTGAAGQPVSPDGTTIAQGRDGNLYLTSQFGGPSTAPTLFKVTPAGVLTSVYSPGGILFGTTLGTDGDIYASNYNGGANGFGDLFKVTPSGTATLLYTFLFSSGPANPYAPPIEAASGIYYGTTIESEERDGYVPESVAYSVTPAGVFKIVHTFTGTDGQNVYASLVQGTDGNFYGCSAAGGTDNDGVIFKMTAAGTVTVLHNFAGTDGAGCYYSLVQGTDGNFYGVAGGGADSVGVVFKISPSGVYSVIHNFNGTTDGSYPNASLIQATDGNLYGVTGSQGNGDAGSIYKVTTAGVLTTLYSFTSGADGGIPQTALMQHTNGLLYGSTYTGGDLNCFTTVYYGGQSVINAGCGVIFSLNIKAKPFVRLVSTSGKVGSKIGVLGQDFSASSVVKFNGMTATTVTRTGTTFLMATVPAGATDGKVTVTTGTTTLTSAQKFVVHNSWSSGAAMPTARFGAFTGAIGTNIYVVGGATNSGYQVTGVNEIYNTSTNKWTTGASDPNPRELGASAVVNGILYVIGGSTSGSNPVNLVEAYNPVSNSWTTKSAMPVAMNSMPAVVDKNIIYVIGGYDPNTQVWYDTAQSYNTTTDTWTTKAPMSVATSWEAVGLLGTTIVAADGNIAPSGASTGASEGYSVTNNTWKQLTADPTPRQQSCFAAINGQLFAAGGAGSTTVLSLNEVYNLTSNSWTTLAAMPNALSTPGSATVGGRLYCIGGAAHDLSSVYNYVQIYQP